MEEKPAGKEQDGRKTWIPIALATLRAGFFTFAQDPEQAWAQLQQLAGQHLADATTP